LFWEKRYALIDNNQKKLYNWVSGEPQTAKEEQPKLRKISTQALRVILAVTKKWLKPYRNEGKQANLRNVYPKEASFQIANLANANLSSHLQRLIISPDLSVASVIWNGRRLI
jgi:hypothetical protein